MLSQELKSGDTRDRTFLHPRKSLSQSKSQDQ